jgi:hypothetical protein
MARLARAEVFDSILIQSLSFGAALAARCRGRVGDDTEVARRWLMIGSLRV